MILWFGRPAGRYRTPPAYAVGAAVVSAAKAPRCRRRSPRRAELDRVERDRQHAGDGGAGIDRHHPRGQRRAAVAVVRAAGIVGALVLDRVTSVIVGPLVTVPDGGIVLALQQPPLRREDDEALVVASRSW